MYWLYILTLSLISGGLAFLINAIVFRLRGQSLTSYVDPKSPLYAQVRQRTSSVVLSIDIIVLLGLACGLYLEVRWLLKANTSNITSPLLFPVVVISVTGILAVWVMRYLNKAMTGSQEKKRKKDDHWLI